MKTLTLPSRGLLLAGACAGLAVFAMGFAGTAQAGDNLTFSVFVGGPNVLVGAAYAYPVYTQPRPVYVQPRPVYVQPAPVYYDRPQGWKHGHYKKHHKHDGHQLGYSGQGYASVYYQQ